MGGTRKLKVRRGPLGWGEYGIDYYNHVQVAEAWGVAVAVVKRLGAVGLLGRRYLSGRSRVVKYARGGLRRALENPGVIQAIAEGRSRRLAKRTYPPEV